METVAHYQCILTCLAKTANVGLADALRKFSLLAFLAPVLFTVGL